MNLRLNEVFIIFCLQYFIYERINNSKLNQCLKSLTKLINKTNKPTIIHIGKTQFWTINIECLLYSIEKKRYEARAYLNIIDSLYLQMFINIKQRLNWVEQSVSNVDASDEWVHFADTDNLYLLEIYCFDDGLHDSRLLSASQTVEYCYPFFYHSAAVLVLMMTSWFKITFKPSFTFIHSIAPIWFFVQKLHSLFLHSIQTTYVSYNLVGLFLSCINSFFLFRQPLPFYVLQILW